VLFGGSEILKKKQRYVTYFDRSVKGLRVGSNVLFKGVRIGYVTDIRLFADIDTLEFGIPVIFEVLPEAVTLVQGNEVVGTSADRKPIDLQRLINAGLRAQLNSESFVTGQLLIELDLIPDSPIVLRGLSSEYPEIPSIPSDIQQAIEDVQRFIQEVQTSVDVRQVMANLQNLVAGLDRIVNSEEVEKSIVGIERFINSEDTQELTMVLRAAGEDLRSTLGDARSLIANADIEVQEVAEKLDPTLNSLEEAISKATRILSDLDRQIGAESEIHYELINTLTEIQGAARSWRVFLEYLEHNPEALLKGKKE